MPRFDDNPDNEKAGVGDAAGGHAHDGDLKHDDHNHEGGADTAHDHSAGESHDHEIVDGELTLADGQAHFLDPGHLFHHVQDSYHFELPEFMGSYHTNEHGHELPGVSVPNLTMLPKGYGKMSKFMFLELVAALLVVAAFVWLARKVKNGDRPKGKIWNLLETFVVFIRDEIVVPTMGKADARRFLPFLLTMFFFILALNLLGMVPFLGSATGSLAVTAVLAILTFGVTVGSGIKKMGAVGFLKAQVPHMDLPKPLAMILIPAIWVIEMFGLFVKHGVLAIRLFANMFAGHLVLAIFIAFIGVVSMSTWYYFVAPVAILGSVALGLLELFVAFLQAYVFTFLASLFIGSAQHAH